jgi:hypothetical protein
MYGEVETKHQAFLTSALQRGSDLWSKHYTSKNVIPATLLIGDQPGLRTVLYVVGTKMSIKNPPGGKGRTVFRADNLTGICELIV